MRRWGLCHRSRHDLRLSARPLCGGCSLQERSRSSTLFRDGHPHAIHDAGVPNLLDEVGRNLFENFWNLLGEVLDAFDNEPMADRELFCESLPMLCADLTGISHASNAHSKVAI